MEKTNFVSFVATNQFKAATHNTTP